MTGVTVTGGAHRLEFNSDAFAPDECFTGTGDTRNRTTVGPGGGASPNAQRSLRLRPIMPV